MSSTTPIAVGVALIGGVAVGIGAGAILFDDDDRPAPVVQATVSSTLSKADETPEPTPIVSPYPTPPEAVGWDPCSEPGLCEFLGDLNEVMSREDIDGLVGMIEWQQIDCASGPLWQRPYECEGWPFGQPIPSVYTGCQQCGTGMQSQWGVKRMIADAMTFYCACGGLSPTVIEKRVRAVIMLEPNDHAAASEFAAFTGPSFQERPFKESSGTGFTAFGLSNTSGEWKIKSVTSAYASYLTEPMVTAEFRYYPLTNEVTQR